MASIPPIARAMMKAKNRNSKDNSASFAALASALIYAVAVNLFTEEERKTFSEEESSQADEILVFNCESASSFEGNPESIL